MNSCPSFTGIKTSPAASSHGFQTTSFQSRDYQRGPLWPNPLEYYLLCKGARRVTLCQIRKLMDIPLGSNLVNSCTWRYPHARSPTTSCWTCAHYSLSADLSAPSFLWTLTLLAAGLRPLWLFCINGSHASKPNKWCYKLHCLYLNCLHPVCSQGL